MLKRLPKVIPACICQVIPVPRIICLLFGIFTILISFKSSFAQGGAMMAPKEETVEPGSPIKELKIGDFLPQTAAHRIINYPESYIDLSGFKGKLLILDFWNTYCGVCIEQFPKYEKLLAAYKDKIQILPVTSGKEKDIIAFWKKNHIAKESKLPSIVNDLTLGAFFKYYYMPHLVWIDEKGKVIATTSYEYMTEEKIQAALRGDVENWRMKEDRPLFSYDEPLVSSMNTRSNNARINYSVLTGSISGVSRKGNHKLIDSAAMKIKRSWINVPIYTLYLSAIEKSGEYYWIRENNIAYNVKDSSRFIYDPRNGPFFDWSIDNTFCYESFSDIKTPQSLISASMFSTLNAALNLNGRLEDRMTDVLVIVKKENTSKTPSLKSGGDLKNVNRYYSFDQLVQSLTGNISNKPVLNETGETGPVDIILNDLRNLDRISRDLSNYNYDIIPVKRKIKMLAIDEL